MQALRVIGFAAGLALVAAAGAAVALLLLSSLGGTPADDPVGRLRPVLPGLPATTAPATTDVTVDVGGTPAPRATTDGDDDHDGGDDD